MSKGKEETMAVEYMGNSVEQWRGQKQCGRKLSSPNRTIIVNIMHSPTSNTGCNVVITTGTKEL